MPGLSHDSLPKITSACWDDMIQKLGWFATGLYGLAVQNYYTYGEILSFPCVEILSFPCVFIRWLSCGRGGCDWIAETDF